MKIVPEVHTGILQGFTEYSLRLCLAKTVLKLKQIGPQILGASFNSITKVISEDAWTNGGNSTRTLPYFVLLFKVIL